MQGRLVDAELSGSFGAIPAISGQHVADELRLDIFEEDRTGPTFSSLRVEEPIRKIVFLDLPAGTHHVAVLDDILELPHVSRVVVAHQALESCAGDSVDDLCPRRRKAAEKALRQPSRAHSYPGGSPIQVKLVADGASGRLLGGEVVGREGAALRVNVLATALTAGMSVAELQGLDLVYAPPFAPVWDPLLVAANQLAKEVG